MLDRYFGHMWHAPRVPTRLVRYGVIYGGSAKDALEEFEPKIDPMLKRQAEAMVAKLQAFIELCEQYDEMTVEGPTEEDDAKAEAKAKAKAKRAKRSSTK